MAVIVQQAPARRWVLRGQRFLATMRRKPLGAAGGICILILIFLAIFAPVLSPYDPNESHADDRLQAPTLTYLLGTDDLGRDLLSRIIYGAQLSLTVGITAVGVGISLGTFVGMISGYYGGKIDLVLQRFVDALMAFPGLILAMTLMAMVGPQTQIGPISINNVMIAVGVVIAPNISRVVRGSVLSVKANQYIEAIRAVGASDARIFALHILPNVLAPIIILATAGLGGAILTEASLSFLGLGTPPPDPSWGRMLSGPSREYWLQSATFAIVPGAAISITVLAFNLLGDAVRDVLDPKLRGRG